MMTRSHIASTTVMIAVIVIFIYSGSNFQSSSSDKNDIPQTFMISLEYYGWFAVMLYLCQYLTLLALPQALFNFLGFLKFNPFPEDPKVQVQIQKIN